MPARTIAIPRTTSSRRPWSPCSGSESATLARPAVRLVELPSIVATLALLGCAHSGVVATDRTVGTAAQFDSFGAEVAKDGSWVVLSQAEAVDGPLIDFPFTLHRFGPSFGFKLFLGTQAGIAIDDHRSSPNQRFLVVERERRLELLDVPAEHWVELASADLEELTDDSLGRDRPIEPTGRTELYPRDAGCFTDFSADSGTLLYLDPRSEGPRLVLRELEGGKEQRLDPGPGVLSWAKLMPAGHAVVVGMTVFDGGPRAPEGLSWPPPLDEQPRCSEPRVLAEGARNVTRVLGRDGQEIGRRPGQYDPMGPGLLQPTAEGGFRWWRPDLDRDLVIPACGGYILFVDPARPRMLEFCDIDPEDYESGRLRLEEFEQRVDLGPLKLESGFVRPENDRYLTLSTSEGQVVLDLDTLQRSAVPKGRRLVANAAGRALIQRERPGWPWRRQWRARPTRVEIVDLESFATLGMFWANVGGYDYAVGSGSVVVHGRRVVDLESGRVLGTLPDSPRAVTPDGRAFLLVDPATKQPRGNRFPRGPLRWFELERPPSDVGRIRGGHARRRELGRD
jgi:hypothetical protein